MAAAAARINATLSQWLRLLWGITPALRLNSDKPYIASRAIHLPARSHWQHHAAAAAHAAAHLVHSPPVFDGDGLGAMARSLMGLLEDARVEALAIRELPGLARLWRPLHRATPELGCGFEALMERLARALVDPDYDDPDPWVIKGCCLFHGGVRSGLPALQTPADIRRVAAQLGHDIGQMRLQFNAKTYSPAPAYRDDHRWMWAADVLSTAPSPAGVAVGDLHGDEPAFDVNETIALYPEWDHLISRLRPDWCRVIEREITQAAPQPAAMDDLIQQTAMRLRKPLRALTRDVARPLPSEEGESFDLDALVEWQVARLLRNAPDARVYRGPGRRAAPAAAWLLVDHSASTSAANGTDGHELLHTAAASACATAVALQAVGVHCAIAGFSSDGRHAVRVLTVKAFDEPAGNFTAARLQTLRPGGSTRLGAALRHVTKRLMEQRNGPRWVIVLSDGQPHDVDVHDPRYLIEDARHAVNAATPLGVRMVCLVPAPAAGTAQKIFGCRSVQTIQRVSDLPRAITRLIG